MTMQSLYGLGWRSPDGETDDIDHLTFLGHNLSVLVACDFLFVFYLLWSSNRKGFVGQHSGSALFTRRVHSSWLRLTMVYAHDSQGLHFVILGFGSSSGAVHSKVRASVPMAYGMWLCLASAQAWSSGGWWNWRGRFGMVWVFTCLYASMLSPKILIPAHQQWFQHHQATTICNAQIHRTPSGVQASCSTTNKLGTASYNNRELSPKSRESGRNTQQQQQQHQQNVCTLFTKVPWLFFLLASRQRKLGQNKMRCFCAFCWTPGHETRLRCWSSENPWNNSSFWATGNKR